MAKKSTRRRPRAEKRRPSEPLLPVYQPEEFVEEAEHLEVVLMQMTDPDVQRGMARIALMLRRAAHDLTVRH